MDDITKIENFICCKSQDDWALNTIQYEWILEHMDAKWEKRKYRDYIVNFLLIHFCCRNNDLDCIIVTEPDFEKYKHNEKQENYLIIMNDGTIQWIRDNYKTNRTLTALTYNIDDDRFIFSVKEIHKTQKFLFENAEERIDRCSIGRVIQNATYNKLGQSLYFNIAKKHFKNNPKKLLEIAKSRPVGLRSVVY